MRSDSSITQLVRKGTQISCLTSKSCIFEQLTELDDGDELGASEIDAADETDEGFALGSSEGSTDGVVDGALLGMSDGDALSSADGTELDNGDELGASEIDDGDELGVSDTAVNL